MRLDERLLAAATRQPDAPLLWAGSRCLTGRDFTALVDSTVQQFQQQGVGAGAFIGWLDHNSPEMLATLAACARLGAVLVPLNWRLAVPELAAIATHAGLSALFHGPALADLAEAVRQQISLACPAAPAQPGDVLLVYTSGTTGAPKGAMHTHHGMLANITMALAVQGLTAADRVLAVLPLFHVGGRCIQVLPALAVGAASSCMPVLRPQPGCRRWPPGGPAPACWCRRPCRRCCSSRAGRRPIWRRCAASTAVHKWCRWR